MIYSLYTDYLAHNVNVYTKHDYNGNDFKTKDFSLNVKQLLISFVILIVGIILSIIAILFEISVNYFIQILLIINVKLLI